MLSFTELADYCEFQFSLMEFELQDRMNDRLVLYFVTLLSVPLSAPTAPHLVFWTEIPKSPVRHRPRVGSPEWPLWALSLIKCLANMRFSHTQLSASCSVPAAPQGGLWSRE